MDSRRVRLSAGLLRAAGAVPEGGRPKAGLADAGYWSEANIRACSWPEMPELLIATTKDWKQRKMLREKGCPRGRIPKGLSPWDRMERKLLTKRGRALYKKRGVLVEPVFGQVKEGQGFRRFMRRGLGAARRRSEPHAVRPLRRQRRLAGGTGMAHNLARWTARIGLGEQIATTKTLRRRFFSLAGRLTRSARRLTLHLPQRWPWETQFSRTLARLRAIPLPA